MNKKAIISFANANNRYVQNIARLSESLRNNAPEIDFLAWIGESSVGAPLHSENPYAFKIYCWEQALKAGYRQILWVDASCFAIKNVTPVFDVLDEDGYIAQQAGYFLNEWCNDETLEYFEISRKETESIPMIGNAGFLGLNFDRKEANQFYDNWKNSMEAGMFKGSWENHRHDMSCSSALWYQWGMKYQPGDQWLQYAGLFDETANDTIIFKAQG
jgi:hypothetical protein